MQKEINKDRILGIIVLAISLLFAYYTTGIKETSYVGDPGPRLFPYIACFIIGISGLILIVRKNQTNYKAYLTKEQWKRFWILFGIYVLNYLLLLLVGYKVAIPVTLALSCFLFSKGNGTAAWKKLVYVAAVSFAMYALYVMILGASLPNGKLGL